MLQKIPKLFLYLLGTVFIINLLQSHFTELIFDEAYYWYYAQNMAWGYFDHPPMVALMIKVSSIFFKGELGVRFMSCVLSVATFIVLWQLIEHKKKQDYVVHFFVLTFSMTLLNAWGFLTLPDTPLLFFTALFLLVYKRFINAPSWVLAFLMGVVMAALMYSKYHAVLVIVFVLLSNLKLLKNKFAWFAVIIALICYTPHFIWLFQNDFVSIKYHLFERPNAAYNFTKYTLVFFLNLLALFGLTFPWVYLSLFKKKPKNLFEKALLYLTYGVLIFFFISSFSRRVQAQWLIVISIPLVVITFQYMMENVKARKWVFRMGVANIVVLLFLRVGLIYEPLFPIVYETHGNKQWVKELKAIAGDNPVVFENSYRFAPMYAFYSGNKSISLNNYMYRSNQYDIDNSESEMQHKKVFYVSQILTEEKLSYSRPTGETFYVKSIADFESFRKLEGYVDKLPQGYRLKIFNPYDTDIDLEKLKFGVAFLNDYKEVREHIQPLPEIHPEGDILSLKSNDTSTFTFKLPKTKMKDPGYFRIGISENGLRHGLNIETFKLK